MYSTLAAIVKHFDKEDYTMDEKQKTIAPTDSGVAKVEKMLGISNMFDNEHLDLNHLVIQALRARFMMHRDKDYVVKNGEIVIVDEFTGRLMFGRRYSDGSISPSKPRKPSRSRAKARLWLRLPSRTTSVCTTSWPA